MARKLTYQCVRWLSLFRHRNSQSGFTLLELLVAMAVGSIIVGTLLFGVVELLQINSREDSRTETQRDIQAALDYISAEIREAVFVYDGSCLKGENGCQNILSFLPTELKGSDAKFTPVLAFWRADELPQTLIDQCRNNPTLINTTAYEKIPCLSRRSFTLVVYYLDTDTSDKTWSGQARIRRYELPQFKSDGTENAGWADPTLTKNLFSGWPYDTKGNNLQVGTPTLGSPPVLVDFVDTASATSLACPSDATGSPLPASVRAPKTGSNSFYACVRGGGASNQNNRNQEVVLFIRGNAAGRRGIPKTANVAFDMKTQVLTRSSYLKQ